MDRMPAIDTARREPLGSALASSFSVHRGETSTRPASLKHPSGCMVCGDEIAYEKVNQKRSCYYCGTEFHANAACRSGHFICDSCHAQDALSVIKYVCLPSSEKDMIALMKKIRSHASFPVHGPEHHSMVPAIILAAYRNTGGRVTDDRIVMGIERGTTIAGGACAFMGACGAAIGVGIAFSIILEANPCKANERQNVQKLTSEVLHTIAAYKAPRCCQRDCAIALREAAGASEYYIGIRLSADEPCECTQYPWNNECIKSACPLWPGDKVCCHSSNYFFNHKGIRPNRL